MVAGASGGSRIITATINVLIQMLHFQKNPAEAVNAPRAHHQLLPNLVCFLCVIFCETITVQSTS